MTDQDTTIAQLKEAVHALCVRKDWGDRGVQNPQHVALAMTVDLSAGSMTVNGICGALSLKASSIGCWSSPMMTAPAR